MKRAKRVVVVSERRLQALLAAEQFCQRARVAFCDQGVVGRESWPWFDRWFRLAGAGQVDGGAGA